MKRSAVGIGPLGKDVRRRHAGVEQATDVGMRQSRQDTPFLTESRLARRSGNRQAQELDRRLLFEDGVLSEIDRRKTAIAKLFDDGEIAGPFASIIGHESL